MIVRLLIVFCLSLFCRAAFAQFTDSTHYHLNLTSSGSVNKATNVNSYLLNNGFTFEARTNNVVFNSNNTWIYGKSNGLLTNNDYSSALTVDIHNKADKVYLWTLVNYNTSFSLKIHNQLLAGGGLAYNIISNKTAWINISDGLLYDQSDLQIDTLRDVYHTFRNSFRLQFRFVVAKIVTVNSSTFLQNSLQSANDYIFRTNNTLSLQLYKWISFTTALSYNNENRTVSENLLFTYGLTFNRYF